MLLCLTYALCFMLTSSTPSLSAIWRDLMASFLRFSSWSLGNWGGRRKWVGVGKG